MKEKKPKFNILKFNESYEPPKNKVNARKGFVEWGEDNNYPLKTFEMYNYTGSSTSKSIINKKTALVVGQGFQPIQSPELQKFVQATQLEREIKKAGLDFEIINGFPLEVIWSKDGSKIVSIKHIPTHKLRKGIESEDVPYPHFLFSNDWENYKKSGNHPQIIREWNPYIKQGKQIYFHVEYNPLAECYPIEQYSNCMNWIEMDYEISRFHLNQIKQGYHPSFILNFATGIPTDEEIEDFNREFEREFKGTKNAGNYLLTYSEGFENRPEFTPVQLNDSDERFSMLIEQSEIQIARGHEIPPQMVILTPGKLSSTEERAELMREFQQAYVTPRQNTIESVLNEILRVGGYTEEIKLAEYGQVEEKPQTEQDEQS
jgi:hypothetical protein